MAREAVRECPAQIRWPVCVLCACLHVCVRACLHVCVHASIPLDQHGQYT